MDSLIASVPVLIIAGAIVIPVVVFLALGLGEKMLGLLSVKQAKRVRPWLWLLIPLALVALILLYPLVNTIYLAFANATGTEWVGLDNFIWAFSGEMLQVLGNNVIWLIVFPIATVVLSIVIGVLFDRVKYERLAMTLIILPTAISFSAGSIIWRQLYSYQPAGQPQLGLLNALWTLIPGNQPIPWLQTPVVNTFCLIFVAVWASLGIAALIISAAVKNVPQELVEAAKLDGAGELRIFANITLPSIAPAVLVVVTTEIIFSLKIFDIVYVMTNGNFGTNVLANRLYSELFASNNLGRASATAVLLLIVALPVIIINIRQFRSERSAA